MFCRIVSFYMILIIRHDKQQQEESSGWVKRTILVASVTEDADAITEMHNAVLQGKRVYAVDAPDGEHDLEDMVRVTSCNTSDVFCTYTILFSIIVVLCSFILPPLSPSFHSPASFTTGHNYCLPHSISFVILDLCKIWHHKFLCWGVILVMH